MLPQKRQKPSLPRQSLYSLPGLSIRDLKTEKERHRWNIIDW